MSDFSIKEKARSTYKRSEGRHTQGKILKSLLLWNCEIVEIVNCGIVEKSLYSFHE